MQSTPKTTRDWSAWIKRQGKTRGERSRITGLSIRTIRHIDNHAGEKLQAGTIALLHIAQGRSVKSASP